jgi:hypothetical protein
MGIPTIDAAAVVMEIRFSLNARDAKGPSYTIDSVVLVAVVVVLGPNGEEDGSLLP